MGEWHCFVTMGLKKFIPGLGEIPHQRALLLKLYLQKYNKILKSILLQQNT
jgi:hypothetical protein